MKSQSIQIGTLIASTLSKKNDLEFESTGSPRLLEYPSLLSCGGEHSSL